MAAWIYERMLGMYRMFSVINPQLGCMYVYIPVYVCISVYLPRRASTPHGAVTTSQSSSEVASEISKLASVRYYNSSSLKRDTGLVIICHEKAIVRWPAYGVRSVGELSSACNALA